MLVSVVRVRCEVIQAANHGMQRIVPVALWNGNDAPRDWFKDANGR